jgi:agmatinase
MTNIIEYLPIQDGFLGIKEKYFETGEEKVVFVPFGLESSMTYGHGTRVGPRAILKASHQIEPFDEEHWCEVYRNIGIETLKENTVPPYSNEALDEIEQITDKILSQDKFPFILGGEHSITAGAIRPFIKKYPDLAILHFDAHAGLQTIEDGESISQASVLRRVMQYPISKLISFGVRNISVGEVEFYENNKDTININFAKDKANWDIEKIIAPLKGKDIYLTFDVDGFDSSIMQATGTPEPGGILYNEALDIIRAASKVGNIVGADIMELSPIKGMHSCDFLVAKLAYKILGYIFKK